MANAYNAAQSRKVVSTSFLMFFSFLMGGHDHCAVVGCKNDRRYPERFVIKEHVQNIRFHRCNEKYFPLWTKLLQREDFQVTSSTRVCSNHFKYGEPFAVDRHPSLFLQGYGDTDEVSTRQTSIKRTSSAPSTGTCTRRPVKKIRTNPTGDVELKPGDTCHMLGLEHDHCYSYASTRPSDSDNGAGTINWGYVRCLEDQLKKLHSHCDHLRNQLFAAKSQVNKTGPDCQSKMPHHP